MDINKMPIGLTPKWLVNEKRFGQVSEAIKRYEEANLDIPLEWHEELHELSLYLTRREIEKSKQL